MNRRIEHALSHTAETVFSRLPRRAPSAQQLARARIVAHRGERNGRTVAENTFAAFDPVVAAGVAAIEFDVRYTRDDEPIVIHDANLTRVFGRADAVADSDWKTLSQRVPQLPHLADVIERYAQRAHLMIELKARGSARAERRLADRLEHLMPQRDFHLLALDPALFAGAQTFPAACYLPVAKLNFAELYRWALANECAGIAGPFSLMRSRKVARLRLERGFVGSGFISKPALMMREIARGVEWLFTNTPLRLQQALDAARSHPEKIGE